LDYIFCPLLSGRYHLASLQKLHEVNNGPGDTGPFLMGVKTMYLLFIKWLLMFGAAAAGFEWIGNKILDKWGK
jgi:hypothetical protein